MAELAYNRAAEEGFLFWASHARVYRAWAQAISGDPDLGTEELEAALESYRQTGTRLDSSTFALMMAEAHLRAERDQEALSALHTGLQYIGESEERMLESEIYRLRGEIQVMRGECVMGEASLRLAIEVAQRQRAKLFELRAAVPLALLLHDQGRIPDLIGLLQPLDLWFTEGRDLPELCKARAMLESVGAAEQPCASDAPPLSAEIKS